MSVDAIISLSFEIGSPSISYGKEILEFAPKLKQVTEEVLFDDIWQRKELLLRERSIITLTALASLGRLEQLPYHIDLSKTHGLNDDELVEIFTHQAFYAGWPAAVSAITRVQDC
ncbi:carboxymuconolactone decarboxylase family protein [Vibrio splendidus]